MSNFEQTIYETPDAWGGENYLMTGAALTATIADLRTVDGFGSASVDDCATLTLQAKHGREAVYEYDHTAPGNERFIIVRAVAFGHYAHSGRTHSTLAAALLDIGN